jgi:hypothetical protein
VVHDVEAGAEDVAHAVENGASAVAHGVENAAKTVESGAAGAVGFVKQQAVDAERFGAELWDKLKYQLVPGQGFDTPPVRSGPEDLSTMASDDDVAAARQELSQNAAAERTALHRLPAGERAAYARVKASLSPGVPPGNEVLAQAALQRMLLDGRLEGQKDLRGRKNLLDDLDRIATEHLAPGVNRHQLLDETVRECDDPTTISQEGKGTCTVTSATMLLDAQHPAEYARLVGELATPGGVATMQNGQQLRRKADWASNTDEVGQVPRSTGQRLLEPALMQYGYDIGGYNNTGDTRNLGPISLPFGGGLMDWEKDKVLKALTGVDYHEKLCIPGEYDSDWAQIASLTARGQLVPASVSWGGGMENGHALLIQSVQGDQVTVLNPWGEEDTFTKEQFQTMMFAYQVPT